MPVHCGRDLRALEHAGVASATPPARRRSPAKRRRSYRTMRAWNRSRFRRLTAYRVFVFSRSLSRRSRNAFGNGSLTTSEYICVNCASNQRSNWADASRSGEPPLVRSWQRGNLILESDASASFSAPAASFLFPIMFNPAPETPVSRVGPVFHRLDPTIQPSGLG